MSLSQRRPWFTVGAFARWTPIDWASAVYLLWFLSLFVIATLHNGAHPDHTAYWMSVDVGLLAGLFVIGRFRSLSGYASDVGRQLYALFVLLPLAYDQAGALGTSLVPSVEDWLIHTDRAVFGLNWYTRHPPQPSGWTSLFEGAYLSNHPILILAFALSIFLPWLKYRQMRNRPVSTERLASFLRERRELVFSVCGSLMTALLLCYSFFPLLPAVTPRLFFPALHQPYDGALHNANWWILARFSIPWGIFPSGHVAGPIAIGSAFAARRKRLWAVAYIIAGSLIGIATVWGDYHFICDAIGGWITGVAGWAVVEVMIRRSRPATAAVATEEAESGNPVYLLRAS